MTWTDIKLNLTSNVYNKIAYNRIYRSTVCMHQEFVLNYLFSLSFLGLGGGCRTKGKKYLFCIESLPTNHFVLEVSSNQLNSQVICNSHRFAMLLDAALFYSFYATQIPSLAILDLLLVLFAPGT